MTTSPALALPELPVVGRITPDLAETCCEWWWQRNAREVDQDRFTKKLVLHSDALTYGQQCAHAQGEAQAAEIKRLREELARTELNRDMWKAQVAAQADQLTAMRKALQPFALCCDVHESIMDRKDWHDSVACFSGSNAPTIGELRAARAALKSEAA